MGFLGAYPAYQVGDKKSVWDLRDYGLSGLWVKRASTVPGYAECDSNRDDIRKLRNGLLM